MKKKYPVILTRTEREHLNSLIAAGTAPARKLTHARILLKADQSPEAPAWVDDAIAEAVAWQQRRDAAGVKIDWRFRTDDARIKLKRLYPSLQE